MIARAFVCSVFVVCLPGLAAAQSLSQSAPADQAQSPPADRWFFPFLIAVVNANYNSASQLPGSWTAFALPEGPHNRSQLNISPANTVIGAAFKFPNVKDTEIGAKIDFNLRGTSPLAGQNTFAPLFGDIYLEMKYDPLRFVFGQTTDIISPLVPTTLNMYPWSYAPGSLGFFRPQIRVETTMSGGDQMEVTLQGGIAQAIQTFQISDEAIARQSGWPDVQARAAFGYGERSASGARKLEVGFWGHFGERNLTLLSGEESFNNSFSFGVDGRVMLPSKTTLQGEYYTGQLVGDYMGGIFQTFDPGTGNPIDAQGFWIEAGQRLRDSYRLHVGYGLDSVEEADLGALVSRKRNEVFYVNTFYDLSPELALAGELAWWRTQYRNLAANDASPFRLEFSVIYKWLGR
jgi:hypothetical protein